jgi:hypothetical protein
VTGTVTVTPGTAPHYSATYTMLAGDTQGTISYTINASDVAGNTASAGPTDSGKKLDRTAPTITNVAVTAPTGTWLKVGGTFTMTFDAQDSGSGLNAPTVALTSGGGAVTGTVTVTPGTAPHYTATYAMLAGDTEGTISYTINASDVAGNTASVGPTDSGKKLDKTAPFVTYVASATADGGYGAGSVIDINVKFSEPVNVTSAAQAPSIALNSGGSAVYNSGTGTDTLVFRYTVGSGDSNIDLNYPVGTSIDLHSGSITDLAGNNANLALPDALGRDSLGTNSNIVINLSPRQNIVLVLDYSGTMDEPAIFGGFSKTKREWVMEAVTNFAGYLLAPTTTSDYRIGIVLYSTDGNKVMDLTDKATIVANPDLITTNITTAFGHALTAMGKGLAWALNMLSYASTPAAYHEARSVIHLADGQQNQPPNVTPMENDANHPGMDHFTIDTTASPSGCPAGMGLIDVKTGDIPIHTLGIQGSAAWFLTLAQIAEVTNAYHYVDEQVWPSTLSRFIDLMPSLFPHSSPQILRNSQEKFNTGGSNVFQLPIDDSVYKLTVCLNWPGSAALTCTLKKGGTIIAFDSIVRKDDLFIGTVQLPHYQPRTGPVIAPRYLKEKRISTGRGTAEILDEPLYLVGGKEYPGRKLPRDVFGTTPAVGSWTLEVSGLTGGAQPPRDYPYLLAVIVDERRIRYLVDPSKTVFWAGEPIPLAIRFSQANPDFTPAVLANVIRPQIPLENFLGINPGLPIEVLGANMPVKLEDVPKAMSKLMQDKRVWSEMRKTQVTPVRLGGRFRFQRRRVAQSGDPLGSSHSETRQCGAYTLSYAMTCDAGKAGTYQRVATHTVLVVARPELASSRLEFDKTKKTPTLVFAPKDRFGNFLGPGLGWDFYMKEPITVTNVIDALNGTYYIEVHPQGPVHTPSDLEKARQKVFEALMRPYFRRVTSK